MQTLTKGGAGNEMLMNITPIRVRLGGDFSFALPYCAYCLSKVTA
jgi:hypothetical protein